MTNIIENDIYTKKNKKGEIDMTNIIEIALFTSHGVGFYPDKLKPFAKVATEMEMRAEIFPDYIRNHKEIDMEVEDYQKLYEELTVGESLRFKNIFYCAEMIPVRRISTKDSSMNLSKEIYEHLKPGETVEDRGRTFYKDEKNQFIYICEPATSKAELVEVDTSRPWTIEEYDGAEYIEYLDYKVVDEKYNYYQKR